jgi:tol-pal system protein YbgF
VKRAYLFFFFLFLSGCVSSNDFARLRSDVHELQRSSSETRKDVDTVKEKTTGVVKEDSLLAIRESQTDILAKVNENARGLQELRGRFDENRYSTEKTFKETTSDRDLLKAQLAALEAQVKSLKDRIAVLEGQTTPKGQTAEPLGTPQQPADASKPEGSSKDIQDESPADSMSASYDAAYQLFKDKKYKEARTKFEAFLKEYPKSDLAANAQFWIAESYYAEKDFESAILSYETLIKKYPGSSKLSGGMLKQGFAFIEIGDMKTGRIILNKLTEKYPGSKDAELAKKKIAELDKKSPKKK